MTSDRIDSRGHTSPTGQTDAPGGHLVVVCGVPGSGKSTTASEIARGSSDAVAMSPDAWMESSGISLWDSEIRAHIEAHQWELSRLLLARGRTVVIEWGTWARSERDELLAGARELGATAELIWLDVPIDELWSRISERPREDPPITYEQVVDSVDRFEPPDEVELSRWDVASHRRS